MLKKGGPGFASLSIELNAQKCESRATSFELLTLKSFSKEFREEFRTRVDKLNGQLSHL